MPLTLNRFPQIIATLEPAVRAALKAGAESIAEDAKQRVAVETGTLRDAIHVDSDGGDYYVVAGDTDAFYGHLVEFGTVRLPARPFLIPAAESKGDAVADAITVALRAL